MHCSSGGGDSAQASQAIDPEESMWSLDDDMDAAGEDVKVLMVNIMRPPLTESEVMYKRGEASLLPCPACI